MVSGTGLSLLVLIVSHASEYVTVLSYETQFSGMGAGFVARLCWVVDRGSYVSADP